MGELGVTSQAGFAAGGGPVVDGAGAPWGELSYADRPWTPGTPQRQRATRHFGWLPDHSAMRGIAPERHRIWAIGSALKDRDSSLQVWGAATRQTHRISSIEGSNEQG